MIYTITRIEAALIDLLRSLPVKYRSIIEAKIAEFNHNVYFCYVYN